MEVLHLLDQLKTFCSRHAALLSVAAVASTLMYWISGTSKPANIRASRSRSSTSSDAHFFVATTSASAGDAGVSGLENVGRNWCYSNGLLQAMASCPVFCSWIEHLLRASQPRPVVAEASGSVAQSPQDLDGVQSSSWLCYGAHSDKMPLISQLNAVIRGVNDAHYGTGSLKGIYEALESHGWQISEGEHDSHEMLSVLCNTIQSELESVERIMGYTQKELKQHENILCRDPRISSRLDPASLLNVAWLPAAWQEPLLSDRRSGSCSSTGSKKSLLPAEKKANKGHLEDVLTRQMVASVRLQSKHMPFGGFFANQLQCLACGSKHAAHWDRFECISLQLPVNASASDVSLVSLLESYTSPDLVEDVTCDHCSKLRGALTKRTFTKRITIGKLPELLVLHINRSVWTDSDNATYKRNDRVWYPMSLNMAAFTYTHAVNNAVGPPNAGVSGVRGLSRLVEARFSARSATAHLPLTRKTASLASAGGVQTCVTGAGPTPSLQKCASSAAPSGDCRSVSSSVAAADVSRDNASSSVAAADVSPVKTARSRDSKFESAKSIDSVASSKPKQLKPPGKITPPRWFHSDSSDQTDSCPNSEQTAAFISTDQPSLVQTSAADIVSPVHPTEENLPAETSSGTNGNANVVSVHEVIESQISISQPEHLYNGVTSSEEVLEGNECSSSTPNNTSSIVNTNEVRKKDVSVTFSRDAEETLGSNNVVNSCTNSWTNDCDRSGAIENMNLIHEKSNSSLGENTENRSTSLNVADEKQAANHRTSAPQEKSSSPSGLVTAVNGPEQSPSAGLGPNANLSCSESPVKDARPSTSKTFETRASQLPSTSTDNSACDNSPRNETSAASSSRSRRRSSEDREHIALYQLRAVIVHSGSASSGHFTTYRRGPLGSSGWYFTSDETVRRCEMTASIGAEPYMLFYERYQSMPPPASTAARLKSSLAAISSSLPYSKVKKSSSAVASSLPLSSDDTLTSAAPLPLSATNDAAYFCESLM